MQIRKLIQNTVEELEELAKETNSQQTNQTITQSEKEFLETIKQKTEVLFLGLQTEDIVNIEDKLEITLKYLEYLLSEVEKRLQK